MITGFIDLDKIQDFNFCAGVIPFSVKIHLDAAPTGIEILMGSVFQNDLPPKPEICVAYVGSP